MTNLIYAAAYAAEMSTWYLSQSDHHRAAIAEYRAGWYICALGWSFELCGIEAMRAGWRASFDADAAMRKVGVRQ